ncbi:hypothetical protein KCP74_03915 [Salmonella enterica subsp. enterica]|nr:hypothetical protein KCP74_03915 [Salmonella enterica subsp. enterica]
MDCLTVVNMWPNYRTGYAALHCRNLRRLSAALQREFRRWASAYIAQYAKSMVTLLRLLSKNVDSLWDVIGGTQRDFSASM